MLLSHWLINSVVLPAMVVGSCRLLAILHLFTRKREFRLCGYAFFAWRKMISTLLILASK